MAEVTKGINEVFYIEPAIEFGKPKDAIGSNFSNIIWDPEDYNITVDLEVITPNRSKHGTFSESNSGSTNNRETIFKGTSGIFTENGKQKNFLTDSFSFISYDEEKGKDPRGINEQLGIESISITYDKNMFPIVSMKMLDIRGFSLFQPNELNSKEKFFDSLFKFPYPMFLLTIKGFYGTKVTYRLAVTSFKSTFNSEVSNYEIDIQFIGHMYGVYTDIPMQFLYAAPYFGSKRGEKNNYWVKLSTDNGFEGENDRYNIPTLKEISENYKDINNWFKNYLSQEKTVEDSFVQNIHKYNQEIELCNDTIALYKEFINSFDSVLPTNLADNIAGYGHACIVSTTETISFSVDLYDDFLTNFAKINFKNNEYSSLKGLEDGVTFGYDISNGDAKPKQSGLNSEEPIKIEEALKNTYSNNTVLKGVKYNTKKEFEAAIDNAGDLQYIKKELLSEYNENKYFYFLPIEDKAIKEIEKHYKELEKLKKEEYVKNVGKLNDDFQNKLGFKPTIKNVFKILYAHLQCFMHFYYENIKEIEQKSQYRKPNKDINVDILSFGQGELKANLPPFPCFLTKDGVVDKNVDTYYENLVDESPSNFPETNLVNNILSSVSLCGGSVEEEGINFTEEKSTLNVPYPISIFDYLYETVTDNGPYDDLEKYLNKGLNEEIIKRIIHRMWLFGHFDENGYTRIEKSGNYARKQEILFENEAKNIFSKIPLDVKNKSPKRLLKLFSRYGDALKSYIIKNAIKEYNEEKTSYAIVPQVKEIFQSTENYKVYGSAEDNGSSLKLLLTPYLINANEAKNIDYSKYDGFYDIAKKTHSISERKAKLIKDINGSIDRYKKLTLVVDIGSAYDIDIYSTIQKERINLPIINESSLPKEKICFPYLLIGGEQIQNLNIKNLNSYEQWYYILASLFNGKSVSIFNDISKCFEKDTFVKIPRFVLLFLGGWMYFEDKKTKTDFPIYEAGDFCYAAFNKKTSKSPVLIENFINKKIKLNILENKQLSWLKEYFENFVKDSGNNSLRTAIFSESADVIDKNLRIGEFKCYTEEVAKAIGKIYSEDLILLTLGNTPYNTGMNKNITTHFLPVKSEDNSINDRLTLGLNSVTEKVFTKLITMVKEGINETENRDDDVDNTTITQDRKLSLYTTLKNLYDKWLCGYDENNFSINGDIKESEFNNFHFVDSFYKDISDEFLINPEILVRMINSIPEEGKNYSFFQFITNLAHENKLLFMALPFFNRINEDTLKEIFQPNFNNRIDKDGVTGPGYIFMYTYSPSSKVDEIKPNDNNEVRYDFDGFDITSKTSENKIYFDNLSQNVAAFGINVGQQNQSIFKNVSISMDNPRETEESLMNLLNLASMSKGGSQRMVRGSGQDLYRIYSSRFYDCRVEMLGCANILPGMYFQLNNVPMFHGAYMIYKVEHRISGNQMLTSFTGQKISKYKLPFTETSFDINSILSQIEEIYDNEVESGTLLEGYYITFNDFKENKIGNNAKQPNSTITYNVPKVIERLKGDFEIDGEKITRAYYNTESKHKCSGVVLRSVAAGLGLKYEKRGINGFGSYKYLEENGFRYIYKYQMGIDSFNNFIKDTTKNCMPGDVAVIKRQGYNDKVGHVCVLADDMKWHSDFVQNTMYVYSPQDNIEEIFVYRYFGNIIPVGGLGMKEIKCVGDNISFGSLYPDKTLQQQYLTPMTLTVYNNNNDANWVKKISIKDSEGKNIDSKLLEEQTGNSAQFYIYCVRDNITVLYNS